MSRAVVKRGPMQRDLVERARAGDHSAFSELARASIGRLYGAAWLILRDDERAEDATLTSDESTDAGLASGFPPSWQRTAP